MDVFNSLRWISVGQDETWINEGRVGWEKERKKKGKPKTFVWDGGQDGHGKIENGRSLTNKFQSHAKCYFDEFSCRPIYRGTRDRKWMRQWSLLSSEGQTTGHERRNKTEQDYPLFRYLCPVTLTYGGHVVMNCQPNVGHVFECGKQNSRRKLEVSIDERIKMDIIFENLEWSSHYGFKVEAIYFIAYLQNKSSAKAMNTTTYGK
ncbi:hypothetical protein WN48_07905 [Eufriesea mexicana]|uniref:Uncharacterized protein n=1 Tax=Eufriesea mexicana TaxID=516756 RepID=A0A310SBD3_9HYME|nr:hypothetical protein WN48_07905 [Eufriesea mexicana]